MQDHKCTATRADGRPCSARALPGETMCWAHSGTTAAKRRAAHAAGGYHSRRGLRAQKLVPAMIKPIVPLLIGGMHQVHRGELEPQRYTAMAAGASAVCRVFALAELEERIIALERDLRRADAS